MKNINKDGVSLLNYKTQTYMLSKNNIDNIETIDHTKRKVSEAQSKKFASMLANKMHFDVGLMTNKQNGKYRLLDGNHRFEGIKLYLDKYPENKVEIQLNYYEDLNEKQEKEMYTRWNLGRKQSTNDFIQQHRHDIPLFKEFQKDFPCVVGVYPTPQNISFYRLLSAYWSATIGENFAGGYSGNARDFVEKSKELDGGDIKTIKAFVKEFETSFGKLINQNIHAKSTPLSAIFRIWWDNLQTLKHYKIKEFFRSRLMNHPKVWEYSKQGGRGSTIQARVDFLRILNDGRTKNLFV